MSRLAELLYPGNEPAQETLDLKIEFLGGMQGFPEIKGHMSGTLNLLCQRCLGGLNWKVDEDFRLVVIDTEEDFDEVVEPFDTVVAGEHGICMTEIVEDELLGSLPLAPMHGSNEDCTPAVEIEMAEEGAEAHESEMNKPFGNLAELMKDAGSSGKKN